MNHTFTPAILIHLGTALAALALGIAVFLRGKGTFTHRVLGRAWAALMLVTAVSTYWIRGNGSFSWIHLLSILTLVLLARGIYSAVTRNIGTHQKTMKGLFYGALIIAGAFSFLQQRLLGHMLWSALGVV